MKNKLMAVVLAITVLLALPVADASTVSAHRSGCHRWHSCPSDTGSYVCGDLGYTSECGTAAAPAAPTVSAQPYVPPVHVPVSTTKRIPVDETVPFAKVTKTTDKEYPNYRKVVTNGTNGTKRTVTEIAYSDGTETLRKVVENSVTKAPVNEVTLVGIRTKPTAELTAVSATKKKNRYDIAGHGKAKSTVVLELNGKRIKRTKTDGKGNFIFKAIKLDKQTAKIVIYERVGRKETKISEPYTVTPSQKRIVSEYSSLHSK